MSLPKVGLAQISVNLSSVPKLNGLNSKIWKKSLEILLGCMDLDLALRTDKLAFNKEQSNTTNIEKCHLKKDCPKYAKWRVKNSKLLTLVCSEVNLASIPTGGTKRKLNENSTMLWHKCLDHISKQRIQRLVSDEILDSFDLSKFESFKAGVEVQLGKNIKVVMSNRGGEYYGKKPNIRHLHVWGCPVEARPNEKKLDARTISCYFVGYFEHSRGFKFYNPTLKLFFEIENAKFLEGVEFEGEDNIKKVVFEEKLVSLPNVGIDDVQTPIPNFTMEPVIEQDNNEVLKVQTQQSQEVPLRRSTRKREVQFHMSLLHDTKGFLKRNFEMKDLGDASFVLEIEILHDRSQGQCPKTTFKIKEMQKAPYPSAVGSLMYAQICTRLHITFIVGVLEIGCQDTLRSTSSYIFKLAGGCVLEKC
ncbi:Retrovirus-related Pol polyprotein from transposon TNT 1-94 [Cucumis melo var. makuwa]|uniref:Retrovirus-related Pol polyprotein from transposon TNT 1-94 n=1 Tax=Cucumis melo var. makuwa TaxID=1194695 RepID=A0A5A7V1S5_CUCMM|nr:Retrovirus-related Pol polyprotein from transposon TNT 1-94 [Cucumis melo var. makuwa]